MCNFSFCGIQLPGGPCTPGGPGRPGLDSPGGPGGPLNVAVSSSN